jgi:hypothetical protein
MIAALTIIGAATFATLPVLAQTERDSLRSSEDAASSKMAPPKMAPSSQMAPSKMAPSQMAPIREAQRAPAAGEVSVETIPVSKAKASPLTEMPPAPEANER